MIPELTPVNDNQPFPPYRINWIECFLIVACVTITIIVTYQGMTSIAMTLAGL